PPLRAVTTFQKPDGPCDERDQEEESETEIRRRRGGQPGEQDQQQNQRRSVQVAHAVVSDPPAQKIEEAEHRDAQASEGRGLRHQSDDALATEQLHVDVQGVGSGPEWLEERRERQVLGGEIQSAGDHRQRGGENQAMKRGLAQAVRLEKLSEGEDEQNRKHQVGKLGEILPRREQGRGVREVAAHRDDQYFTGKQPRHEQSRDDGDRQERSEQAESSKVQGARKRGERSR